MLTSTTRAAAGLLRSQRQRLELRGRDELRRGAAHEDRIVDVDAHARTGRVGVAGVAEPAPHLPRDLEGAFVLVGELGNQPEGPLARPDARRTVERERDATRPLLRSTCQDDGTGDETPGSTLDGTSLASTPGTVEETMNRTESSLYGTSAPPTVDRTSFTDREMLGYDELDVATASSRTRPAPAPRDGRRR